METVKLKKVGTLPLCLPCRPYYCSATFPLDKPIPLSILGDWSDQIYPQGYVGGTDKEGKNIKFYYMGEFTGDIGIAELGVKAIKFFATIDGEITNEVTGVVLTSYIKNYYWDVNENKGYIAPLFKYTDQSTFPQEVETEGVEVNKTVIDLTKIPKSQLPWYEIRFTRRFFSEQNTHKHKINFQIQQEDGAAYDGTMSSINANIDYSDLLVNISYPASYCRKLEPVWKKIPESVFNWNIKSSGEYDLNAGLNLLPNSYNLDIGDFGNQIIGDNKFALTDRYQILNSSDNNRIEIEFQNGFDVSGLKVLPIEYSQVNAGGLLTEENNFQEISQSQVKDITCNFDNLWYDMIYGTYDRNEIEKNNKRLLSDRFSISSNEITLNFQSDDIQDFIGIDIAIIGYTQNVNGGLCGFLNMEDNPLVPYLRVEDITESNQSTTKIWKTISMTDTKIEPRSITLYNNESQQRIQDIRIYLRYHSNRNISDSKLVTDTNKTNMTISWNSVPYIQLYKGSSTQSFRLEFSLPRRSEDDSESLAQILNDNINDIKIYNANNTPTSVISSSNGLNQLGFPSTSLKGKHQVALNIEVSDSLEDYTFKALKLRQVNESSDFGYILEVFKEDNSSNETKVNIQIGDLFQFKEDSKYLKINNDNDNDNDIYNINNIYIIQKLFENNKIAAFSYYRGNNNITGSSKKIIGLVDISTITLSKSLPEVTPSLDLLATQEDYKQLFCDLLKIKYTDYVSAFYDGEDDNSSDNFYFSFPSSILSNIASVRKWEQTCQTFWNIFYSLLFFFGYDVYSETLTQSEAKENLLANYNFTNFVSAEAEQLSDIILSVLSKTQTFIIDNKRYSFHQNFYQLRISKNKIELAYLEPQDNPQKVETTSNTGIEENQQNISSSNATNTSEN